MTSVIAEQRGNRADSVTNIKPFDPNTASQSDLEKAGISPVVARRMVNFVSKGGRFLSKKDLLRIYGFDTLLFHRIEAKIVISPVASGSKGSGRREFSEIGEGKVSERQQDLNQADTADLKRVKGIGDKLSLRIVRYRDALGGFVSLNQLKEIYKLDSSVIKRVEAKFFISPDFEPVKLNINTAERQILAVHPYISDKAATAIVAYRFQHGEYKMLEDLRHIPFIDSIMFRKTFPYLKLTD